ncbi:MAG: flagellar biosynthesis anti-sigma factor FlgM [Steroidobacteraceae bacterium]
MNVKVTGNEVRPPQGGGTSGVGRREAPEVAAASQSATNVANAGAEGTVQIGATTRHLLDLAKSGNATDVVDMAKVERLRAAVADGSYRVDSKKVADQLVRFEFLLGRVTGDIKDGS